MIVTCEQCSRRFHLDESRIPPSGSKVRCSRCKHVFKVFPPPVEIAPAIEPIELAIDDMAVPSFAFPEEQSPRAKEVESDQPIQQQNLQETMLLDADSLPAQAFEIKPQQKTEPDIGLKSALTLQEPSFDLDSELKLEMEEPSLQGSAASNLVAATPVDSEEKEEMGISLDDLDLFPESPLESKPEEDRSFLAVDERPSDPSDSSFMEEIYVEDTGKEPEVALDRGQESSRPTVSQAAAASKSDTISFDDIEALDLDEIERLIEKSQSGSELQASEPSTPQQSDTSGGISFDRLDLDDGGSQAGPAVNGGQSPVPTSFTETAVLDTGALMPGPPADNESDGGDSPVPKARKGVSKTLVGLLCLAFLAGIGYVGMQFFPDIKIPFLTTSPPQPEDIAGNLKIRIFDVNSKFADSSVLGKLFVITGKIRNDYPEPRGFVQIRGKLYDAAKKVIQSQSGYCGNVISDSDLATMNEEAIKKALSNRLGANHSDAKIPPGATVPFMIVFSRLPDQMDEFSLEAVSSAKIP